VSSQPDICALLNAWWGGGLEGGGWLQASASAAANIIFGSNPVYQISDFLAIYPKFGTEVQALVTVLPGTAAGSGYIVNDVLAVVQPDASGGTVKVIAVDGSGGIVSISILTGGTGYSVANGLTTTGGTGSGATVNVTAISSYTSLIPQPVLQLYINLASASLSQARWLDNWPMGMALFIAHYATLYLRSEGSVGTTAQQIASSGLAIGLKVSQAAGDVSQTQEYMTTGWESWGSWNLTTYGQQLITIANIVGIGTMYVY
jgi:hypothetical protein